MTAAISSGWGRVFNEPQRVAPLRHRFDDLPSADEMTVLPFGNGRSYGDSCLNSGGLLIDCRQLDRFISFDRERGIVRCEAGVLLGEILALAVPTGWILPVLPGTQYVTVGGAIANDVHGKNHHSAGTFGCHVTHFELARSDGDRLLCSRDENAELFAATVGGLGLTGLIVWAEIQLKEAPSPIMRQEVIRFENLSEFFELSRESDGAFEYTVAWIDCLSQGSSLGRGLFSRANHATETKHVRATRKTRDWVRVPFTPPLSLVNSYSLRTFNYFYYNKQKNRVRSSDVHYKSFFFPLDTIKDWNRIYGPRGFFQYQCVVPTDEGPDGIAQILRAISRSGRGSFLAVLKEFGEVVSPGMLSFPRTGVTLALDFANCGNETFALFETLDEIVKDCGGALYPAKDARMSRWLFEKSFPALDAYEAQVDPGFSSSFWRRVRS